jgi:hypothetical protein
MVLAVHAEIVIPVVQNVIQDRSSGASEALRTERRSIEAGLAAADHVGNERSCHL